VATVGGKEELGMPMGRLVLPQPEQRFGGERYVSVLGSFAVVDMHESPSRVDITDLQVQSFVESQAHRVHGPEVDGDMLGGAGVDDGVNLRDGDDLGEP
jgi:hypothetical protein